MNAVGTPLGRYQKAVSDAIGSRWYYYIDKKMRPGQHRDGAPQAEVDAQGRVQELRVVSNNANEAFANICLQSFQEARIPPIPPDLIATLPEGECLSIFPLPPTQINDDRVQPAAHDQKHFRPW